MSPEYMPWYHPGADMLRCGGDRGCGALIVEGDIQLHNKWHKKVEPANRTSVPTLDTLDRGNF